MPSPLQTKRRLFGILEDKLQAKGKEEIVVLCAEITRDYGFGDAVTEEVLEKLAALKKIVLLKDVAWNKTAYENHQRLVAQRREEAEQPATPQPAGPGVATIIQGGE